MTRLLAVVVAFVVALGAPYRRWWEVAAPRERAAGAVVGLAIAALSGAFLFGAWHVIGGGFIKGNWRAGGFGVALAAATGVLLAVGHLKLGPHFRRD